MSEKGIKKLERILGVYTSLLNGETVASDVLAEKYNVSVKSVIRDMEEIELFLSDYNIREGNNLMIVNVEESRRDSGKYKLVNSENKYMSRSEIMAVCKILMDSRALNDIEMNPILTKLLSSTVTLEDKEYIRNLLLNEWYNYIEPSHGKLILENLLTVSGAVKEQRLIRINYTKKSKDTVERIIEPLGVIFSEYYFYLAGNIQNIDKDKYFDVKGDENPTMYRIDRIDSIEVLNEKYTVQEAKRFKEGEYRKRIQFMFGGELNHIKLLVKDFALEAVKDHLPTAKVSKSAVEGYDHLVEAESFGDGIVMWLMGQAGGVKLIGPERLVEKISDKAREISDLYIKTENN